jgi:hypothetical protein
MPRIDGPYTMAVEFVNLIVTIMTFPRDRLSISKGG